MRTLALLLLIALSISCDKNEDEIASDNYEVTTAGTSVDCGLLLIDFKESDLHRIEKITNSNGLRYEAYNLNKQDFSEEGQVLTVRLRKTLDSEFFACTTLGIGYPWVTVLEAELK
tara:strand:- start:86 stop:433 length:348 start_codon:yes stop_codon:yes gene_type:complete